MNRLHVTLAFTTFVALGLAAAPTAQAQSYTLNTLASFNGVDGSSPQGTLILSGSTLYGTTFGDGTDNDGTVFSVSTSGGTPTAIATFTGVNGANPQSSLTLSGSTLYGTTFGDGTDNDGTVFSVSTSGGTLKTLATFNDANGNGPTAGVILSGSTLYGTTSGGGASSQGTDEGIVYSLPVAGGSPTTLLTFTGSNGETPNSGLTLIGSTLYGTTNLGGANSVGSLFSVTTSGSTSGTVASFSSATGDNPFAGLTLVGSTFYGTTLNDGTGRSGTLFSVPDTGGTPTALVDFTGGNDGANPYSGLTLSADGKTLFGTTENGGANGGGTVFSYNIASATLTTIAAFDNTNEAVPLGGLTLGANGVLYGTTSSGGDANGDGIIFSLTPIAAPEPSSRFALILGFLGLGVLTLRAQRKGKISSNL